MTEWSYHVDCEECRRSISAASRFCKHCSTEQQRAAEVLDEISATTEPTVRTDGGETSSLAGSAHSPELGDSPTGVAGVIHDKLQRANRARNHCFAEGIGVDDDAALEGYDRAEHPISHRARPYIHAVANSGLPIGPMPLWLWWLIVVAISTASGVAIYYGGGGL